ASGLSVFISVHDACPGSHWTAHAPPTRNTGHTMKKTLIAAAFATFFAGQALAAPQTYVVDPSHTFPRFSDDRMGMCRQILRFSNTSGTVAVDAEAKEGKVDIAIDMRSVGTGFELFDEHIQGEDFVDTEQFPAATS